MIIGAIVLVVVLAVIAFLVWQDKTAWKRDAYLEQSAARRIWVVEHSQPRPNQSYGVRVVTLGDPVTFPADQLRVHDRFRCERGTHAVHAYLVADWMDERGGSNNRR